MIKHNLIAFIVLCFLLSNQISYALSTKKNKTLDKELKKTTTAIAQNKEKINKQLRKDLASDKPIQKKKLTKEEIIVQFKKDVSDNENIIASFIASANKKDWPENLAVFINFKNTYNQKEEEDEEVLLSAFVGNPDAWTQDFKKFTDFKSQVTEDPYVLAAFVGNTAAWEQDFKKFTDFKSQVTIDPYVLAAFVGNTAAWVHSITKFTEFKNIVTNSIAQESFIKNLSNWPENLAVFTSFQNKFPNNSDLLSAFAQNPLAWNEAQIVILKSFESKLDYFLYNNLLSALADNPKDWPADFSVFTQFKKAFSNEKYSGFLSGFVDNSKAWKYYQQFIKFKDEISSNTRLLKEFINESSLWTQLQTIIDYKTANPNISNKDLKAYIESLEYPEEEEEEEEV